MDEITEAFTGVTTLFGVFVILAVSVAGFAVGRRWLARVDGGPNPDDPNDIRNYGYKDMDDFNRNGPGGSDYCGD